MKILMQIMLFTLFVSGVAKADVRSLAQIPVYEFDELGNYVEKSGLDLTEFKGKVVIFRFSGTWCPDCLADEKYLSSLFSRKILDPSKVIVVILNYESKIENTKTVSSWIQNRFPALGFPQHSVKHYLSRMKPEEMVRLTEQDGQAIFPDAQGVPYGLIIDASGKIVMRGNFKEGIGSDPQYLTAKKLMDEIR